MVKRLATAAACIGVAVAALYWGQGYIIGFIYGRAMKSYRTAEARGTEAYCLLSRHDHTLPIEQGPCALTEGQEGCKVTMKPQGTSSFEAKQQGIRYQRTDTPEGIRLNREGAFSLQVLWRKQLQCTGPIAAPVSVVFINLGDAPQR